jgi:hypothetical protein
MLNLTHIFTCMGVCRNTSVGEHCISGGNILDSDVARYAYAADVGGVYHDDDAEFVKLPNEWPAVFPHLPWRNASIVIGIEFPRPYVHVAKATSPGCCLQFVQWSFACSKGSLIMKSIASLGRQNLRQNPTDTLDAVYLTGPAMFTHSLWRHIGHEFDLDDVEARGAAYTSPHTNEIVLVLPYRSFGLHPMHKGNHIRRNPVREQLVRHHFRGRWK